MQHSDINKITVELHEAIWSMKDERFYPGELIDSTRAVPVTKGMLVTLVFERPLALSKGDFFILPIPPDWYVNAFRVSFERE